jgi:pilus assembly protein Flp/PilA
MSFNMPVDNDRQRVHPKPSSYFHKELAMNGVVSKVRRFLTSEDGPTAVEYAVMLALIVVAIIVVVQKLGQTVSGTFSTVSSAVAS